MIELFSALALVLVLEGLVYAAFPEHMKKVLAASKTIPHTTMRAAPLASAPGGVFVLWLLRG